MQMSPALAYRERDLEEDPLAVARKLCPECKGTGRTLIALATIVEQMKESRLELLVGPKKMNRRALGDSEYIDPDDCL
jgi:hypothetical protein